MPARPGRTSAPAPLRREVGLLGALLGQVLQETGGPGLLDDVEALRRAVIRARRDPTPARERRVSGLVGRMNVDRAEQVARAFTAYFHLVNLAEERHRVRVLRERGRIDTEAVPGSLAAAVAELGPDLDLAGLRVHPVLTAHPTEARRRALTQALRRIDDQLDRLDDPRSPAAAREEARRRLLEEVTVLWRTALLRVDRPRPLDEVRAVMAVFDDTLFRGAPALYRAFELVVSGERAGTEPPRVPAFLRLGSWVGGDRDGNPGVVSGVTREAMAVQADHVLRGLENVAIRLSRTLTVEEHSTPASPALREALDRAAADAPRLVTTAASWMRHEPHRLLLRVIADRIVATRQGHPERRYAGPDELLQDLRVIQESLAAAGATRLAYGEMQHFIWQVETFGFHLAELEVRQHSSVHAAAIRELAGDDPDLAALAVGRWPPTPAKPSERTAEVLATFRVMAELRRRWGPGACRRYVVSFTSQADDLLAVLALANLAGNVPVDVVPLFETLDDLQRATAILTDFANTEAGSAALSRNGRRFEVMLGYSDSAKDTGATSATFALHRTQAQLVGWAKEHDVELTMFHGRGGALGRGGGPAHRAVLAQAPGSVAGRFKLTEQGEVIFARYGNPAIAQRHFEQVTAAVLLASTPKAEETGADAAERFAAVATAVDRASRTAYRSLLETDGFAAWFARVSPLEELGNLQIGSRPARRGTTTGLDDLRAIPWVFAWAQNRCNLPGWYGLGSGLAAADLDELQAAYREWPLFTTMLDNAEMSLAKADRSIAVRYLELGERPDLTELVLAELDLTTRLVLEVTGHDRLLGGHPVLARAVDLRNPYVDALSALQLHALHGLRAGAATGDTELQILLLLTVNGVAAGLQNTG